MDTRTPTAACALGMSPVLVTDAGYHGTLAAVRAFGRAGIAVTVASPSPNALAATSRFAHRWVAAPPTESPRELLDWLDTFGRANPGYHLAITSDDLAWLVAHHLPDLQKRYLIYSPGAEVLRRVLDKKQLAEACAAVGIPYPLSYFPSHSGEVPTCAAAVGYPLLLKPRTQVLRRFHGKGIVINSAADLAGALDKYTRADGHHPDLLAERPELNAPIVQRYYQSAAENILSVAGFVDAEGELVALAARKVLQHPRRLGIGLCFEAMPLSDRVREQLAALCRHVGYFGVFEAEFIEDGGLLLLIDFNPRFYGQVQFDVDRRLNLPLLSYRAALGENTAELVRAARVAVGSDVQPRAYLHRIFFPLMLVGQRVTGRMSASDLRRWRAWRAGFGSAISYAVFAEDDVRPMHREGLNILKHLLRHPRSSARDFFLDS